VQDARRYSIAHENINKWYNHNWSRTDFRDGENTKLCAKSTKLNRLLILVSYLRVRGLTVDTYCGLCGKQGPLKQTDCCNRTICDMSEDPFTNPENVLDICPRNHRLYTLCGIHYDNHPQTCDWRDCQKCKDNIIPFERFVGYGTSRYNFDGTWKDPPTFPPTNCEKCGKLLFVNLGNVIYKADGGCICAEHQQLPPSLAKSLLSSGKFKVESFGMS